MAKEEFFNDHRLVDFNNLLNNDLNEINHLQNAFETNGWCFIRLPDEMKQLDEIQTTLLTFFNQDQTKKSEYKSSNAFGYSRINHKEGIRILINEHGLQNFHYPFDNDMEQTLQILSRLSYNLTTTLKTLISQMPILSHSPSKDAVFLSPLSMLDIAHYFNERPGPIEQPKVGLNTNEVNCVPHFDPGLFSLSILSTCDGLQLHDRLENKWIDGPNNSHADQRSIGVVWLGEAASILTQDRFKTGIHRVVYPQIKHQSRLTIWQEICTRSQIEPLIPNNEKSIAISDESYIQTSSNNDNVLPGGASITMTNQPNSQPFLVLSRGETLTQFMNRVEEERGLSISKSGIEHIQIKFPIRVNKKDNSTNKLYSFFSKFFKK